ncbi:hypothetical protein EBR43_10550 [bacterium]|nr:hypothetical protein [bacterium]
MATLKPGLTNTQSIQTDHLGGPGPIAFDESQLDSLNEKRKEIIDYIRLRLADQIVDVELDKEHYELAIKQALVKYRQRSSNSQEDSYAFLDLMPEVQEYILPKEIMTVRSIHRRGIGSVTGTTASQFEPFASGYLNTYMLVAGRVGGLLNYELFVDYQKLSMKMFGGFIDFNWNSVTKKLTLVRKIPSSGHNYIRITELSSDDVVAGSVITIKTEDVWNINVGDSLTISNCKIGGYNNNYRVETVDDQQKTFTVLAKSQLHATQVVTQDLRSTQIWSNVTDVPAETVLLRINNYKPDIMLLNDHMVFPWLQEYAYSFAKRIVGEARSKYGSVPGPQGATTLNGTALLAEAQAEMEKLEEELKRFVDGSVPYYWVMG